MADLIYCIEDDRNIRELVIYALKSAGFSAVGFESAKEFYKELKGELPALLLLDIMLPDEDGISILKRIKGDEKTKHIPVIMLTAKSTEYDKVIGLDMGADDYVTKPFGVMELISRVKAVLRRSKKEEKKDILQIGEVYLDEKKHVITVNNKEITLTYKEFALLAYLMKNKGIVLSRDRLLDIIWNYEYEGESRTVDVHIGSLRQKLGESGNMIETIRGVGYKIGDQF